MSIRIGRGIIAAWVALVAAGALLAFIARRAGPLPGDLALARSLQRLPLPDGIAGTLLTNADSAVWLILAVALVIALVRRRWSAALFVLLTSLSGVLVSLVLKFSVARPRPSSVLVRVQDPADTYGFPSTTAVFSVVLLGALVYLLRRGQPPRPALLGALAASAIAILTLGLSRVYVGEHWATDVLGAGSSVPPGCSCR